MRAALISGTVTGMGLLLIGWSLLQPWKITLAVGAFVAIACAMVISRLPLHYLGVVLIGLFCFTASWDETWLAGILVRQWFLVLGGLLLATGLRRLPPVPWWLHAYGVSAIVATCLQVLFPVGEAYLDGRYATSASGQALGDREGPMHSLLSLLSLLFNNYAAPIVIVLACMCVPRALKWLIGAYVAGTALSCVGAILGYYGQPWLVDFIGGLPVIEGVRAAGFTSHSLRLATSGVMALALACWLAIQPHRGLKWFGWMSVPVLLLGLYVSGSRGGTVAGLLVLVLSMFMLPAVRSRIHLVVSGVGAALLGLYLLSAATVERVIGSTRVGGDDTTTVSDVGRAEVFDQGVQDFQNSPVFGIGVQFIAEAHTLYMGVLAGGGIILGAGFLLFNVGSIRTSLEALKVDRSLGGALLATLIASLAYWTVADLFQTKTVAIIYGFLIALWWRGQENDTASPTGHEATGRREVMTRAEGAARSSGVRPE